MSKCKLCGSDYKVESYDKGDDMYYCSNSNLMEYPSQDCPMSQILLTEKEWNTLMTDEV